MPFKGAPEALTEVLTGRVDFYFCPITPALPFIRDGKLLALAVSSSKRASALPDVPTTIEAGFPDSDFDFWIGMVVPKKTPRDIVTRMHQETVKGLRGSVREGEARQARRREHGDEAGRLRRPHRARGAHRSDPGQGRRHRQQDDGDGAGEFAESGVRANAMLRGFTRTDIETSGARIVTVRGGNGPPLLLMHGNPFSHLSWHKIAPRLADEFTVVATDLRGYGDSEKPPGGADHSGYSFRAMAQDQVEVMAALGFTRFYAAGHDRGARVLHRMCLDHPDRVARAAILDILPQHHLLNNVTRQWGTFSWHWFFMIQPYDFPERLMGADPDYFIEKKLAKTAQGLSFFDPAALAEYKRCFRDPATIHAMCEDYRATHGVDLDMDSEDFAAGRKIACPCCSCGARPAASAAITSRWRSGRATRPTSAAARHSRAGTIFRKKRRRRPIASCARSFRHASRESCETDAAGCSQIRVNSATVRTPNSPRALSTRVATLTAAEFGCQDIRGGSPQGIKRERGACTPAPCRGCPRNCKRRASDHDCHWELARSREGGRRR